MVTRHPKTIYFWRGELPHWQVENGRYFVTIHLHGAIPVAARMRIRDLCAQVKNNEGELTTNRCEAYLKLSRKIFAAMEYWLDRTPSVSHFATKELSAMVAEAIENRQKRRIWEMFSDAIMPSHLHLFFDLNDNLSLKWELEEFKRWTGHRATKLQPALSGMRFWQTEWFDHWSRSDEEDDKIVKYIQNNPVKTKLVGSVGEYPYCK